MLRPGSPENRTAFVTSSETISSAVSAVLSLIPRHEFRNERVYRRAQNGALCIAARPTVPHSEAEAGQAGAIARLTPVQDRRVLWWMVSS